MPDAPPLSESVFAADLRNRLMSTVAWDTVAQYAAMRAPSIPTTTITVQTPPATEAGRIHYDDPPEPSYSPPLMTTMAPMWLPVILSTVNG